MNRLKKLQLQLAADTTLNPVTELTNLIIDLEKPKRSPVFVCLWSMFGEDLEEQVRILEEDGWEKHGRRVEGDYFVQQMVR